MVIFLPSIQMWVVFVFFPILYIKSSGVADMVFNFSVCYFCLLLGVMYLHTFCRPGWLVGRGNGLYLMSRKIPCWAWLDICPSAETHVSFCRVTQSAACQGRNDAFSTWLCGDSKASVSRHVATYSSGEPSPPLLKPTKQTHHPERQACFSFGWFPSVAGDFIFSLLSHLR